MSRPSGGLARQQSKNLDGGAELLNLLGDVKSRVQEKVGAIDFPTPWFLLVGKQSVGKSRLIETLAGEVFNFISGTLGSRRPTVLEFRNVPANVESVWFVKLPGESNWTQHKTSAVMQIVGKSHEELGSTVSTEPIHCRIESAACMDMQIVDLPGFRDFALDRAKQELANEIADMDMNYMRDPKNIILCVEQAGDAATMSTLQKCREVDPDLKRTILIRNKLDKYYADLTADNINKWVDGYGDLPKGLASFALTLPFWKDGQAAPANFRELAKEKNDQDLSELKRRGLSEKFTKTIGIDNFANYMAKKVEQSFAESINPVLQTLREYKDDSVRKKEVLEIEEQETNPAMMVATTRDCGVSFATALTHVMEGVLELDPALTLEDELREFHDYHNRVGSTHFTYLPTEDFNSLTDYIDYLQNELVLPTFDIPVNGGAQFRRLMMEVEVFLRFSEIATDTKKRDVIQAKGVNMSTLTWREVVVKLLSTEAHGPLHRRICYVGERVRWFFERQKEAIISFMTGLDETPAASIYSPLLPKHAKLIRENEMIRKMIFQTYDAACLRHYEQFVALFDNMLTSTFANPWVFLKGATNIVEESDDLNDYVLPSFDDTKERIPREIEERSTAEETLNNKLAEIPTMHTEYDDAVDKVQMLVLSTYAVIRAQVCDQVELFAESFFKLPMLRRLEEDMVQMELSEEDQKNYEARRDRLEQNMTSVTEAITEMDECITKITNFKLKVQRESPSV